VKKSNVFPAVVFVLVIALLIFQCAQEELSPFAFSSTPAATAAPTAAVRPIFRPSSAPRPTPAASPPVTPEPEKTEENGPQVNKTNYNTYKYIGNRNTLKFHETYCSYLPDLRNRVYFYDREEAVDDGYIPCQKCFP